MRNESHKWKSAVPVLDVVVVVVAANILQRKKCETLVYDNFLLILTFGFPSPHSCAYINGVQKLPNSPNFLVTISLFIMPEGPIRSCSNSTSVAGLLDMLPLVPLRIRQRNTAVVVAAVAAVLTVVEIAGAAVAAAADPRRCNTGQMALG